MTSDDLGRSFDRPASVRRVVSLVPSLTEAVASAPGRCWSGPPTGARTRRPGRHPRAGHEEPRRRPRSRAGARPRARQRRGEPPDRSRRPARGRHPVYVTDIRTVDGASRRWTGCSPPAASPPGWLDEAEEAWAPSRARGRRRAVVPSGGGRGWRSGRDTFTGEVLDRLGVDNVFADTSRALPALRPGGAAGADLVVLPDEPYVFTADDGPERSPARRRCWSAAGC